ncbi:PepSY domain-containing protein [Ligilactobacillus salitolerans]|nr:PepSY domain-containing protein [Ligilactobacillus salitolerans]
MKPTKLLLLAASTGLFLFGFAQQPEALHLEQTVVYAQKSKKLPKIAKVDVTAKQAIAAFKDKYPGSSITGLNLEKKLGKYYYEIDGVDDNKEHSLTLNANTKKRVQSESENLDADEKGGKKRDQDKISTKKLISVKKAVRAAQKKVKSGKVTEVSLDNDVATTYWEVKFKQKTQETSVQLDATTGKYLGKDVDTDD